MQTNVRLSLVLETRNQDYGIKCGVLDRVSIGSEWRRCCFWCYVVLFYNSLMILYKCFYIVHKHRPSPVRVDIQVVYYCSMCYNMCTWHKVQSELSKYSVSLHKFNMTRILKIVNLILDLRVFIYLYILGCEPIGLCLRVFFQCGPCFFVNYLL